MGNHLWQSTLFLGVVALLSLALKRNRPQVRYRLWCAASIKFLVPCAALVAFVNRLMWRPSLPIRPSQVTDAVELISQPFSTAVLAVPAAAPAASFGWTALLPSVLLASWLAGCAVVLATWIAEWRRASTLVRQGSLVTGGREWEMLRALEREAGIARPIAIVASDATFEPGVFGVVRPVLLWSRSLGARLSDREVDAVLAHEVSHVRRRDNFMAVIQMVVEAVFWFHPLVWWIERQLVEERERACDDEVLRRGRAPHVYAESLLKICEWCVETPLACVAGVTGSDLKARVEGIMKNTPPAPLTAGRTALVSVAAAFAVVIPVVVGLSNVPRLRAQGLQPAVAGGTPAFDVATIKRNPDVGGPRLFPVPAGGRVRLTNQTLRTLINSAYRIQDYQIIGGPDWARTQGFDIEAIVEATPPPPPPQMLLRIQTLLADRFKLVMHAETRQLPIYRLVKNRSDGRLGPNLRPSACTPPDRNAPGGGGPAVGGPSVCGNWGGTGLMQVGGNTMNGLANQLGRLAQIGRPVVNETNLTDVFDWELKWTPDPSPGSSAPSDAVSIFTALQEQLGLKLEATRGPVDVLVIDSVQQPSDDQGKPSGALTAPRSFEVASVKPNTSGDARVAGGFQQGGRYRVTNYTLRALIAAAYVRPQVNPDFLISSGPKWIDAEHFDVEAKGIEDVPAATGADTAASPRRVMLQKLLAERFKLRVHTESSDRPIYALVVARADGKTGPQLRPSAADCTGTPALCAPRIGPGSVAGTSFTLAQLVNLLPRFVNRVVVDRTGLAGTFAVDLTWTPAPGEWIAPPLPGVSDPRPDGPSLFTAVQEQLGLKLEATRGPVDVLVIDSAERPTPD